MKRRIFIIIGLFLCVYSVSSQESSTSFYVRNFQNSLVQTILNIKLNHIYIDEYGSMNKFLLSYNKKRSSFLYQGQEYDPDLNLYFFQSRVYDFKTKSFQSPDPKSQYSSPYVFVNADPVNIIDLDGNAGKPLVLYGEDHSGAGKMDLSTQDFFNELPDAHYLPLSKFVNAEVGDLPEWNGRVFVLSHMSEKEGREIELARSKNMSDLNTKLPGTSVMEEDGFFCQDIDAFELGKQLRLLSDSKKAVKSVVAGGCQGSFAGKRIKDGFVDCGKTSTGGKLAVYGAKPGKYAFYSGKLSETGDGNIGPDHLKFYLTNEKDERILMTTKTESGEDKIFDIKRFNPETNLDEDYNIVEGQEFRNFVSDCRISSTMRENFAREFVHY